MQSIILGKTKQCEREVAGHTVSGVRKKRGIKAGG